MVSNHGLTLLSAPSYLIYLLDLLASMSITLSVYSLSQALKAKLAAGAATGFVSSISVLTAGISVGCACQAPILYNFLYFFGLNSLEASSIVVAIDNYEIPIMSGLILLNLITIIMIGSKIKPPIVREKKSRTNE